MPNTKTIPPGAYKLAHDVQNPSPDRRSTRDWRKMPVWNKGTQFVVKEQRRMGDRHLVKAIAGLEPDVVAALRAKDRYTVIELAGDRRLSSRCRSTTARRSEMPVLLFTVVEVTQNLLKRQRELSAEIREASDLTKKPLDPGESVAARHHKLAKLGKQLADIFDQFDKVMLAASGTESAPDPEPASEPPTNPQAN